MSTRIASSLLCLASCAAVPTSAPVSAPFEGEVALPARADAGIAPAFDPVDYRSTASQGRSAPPEPVRTGRPEWRRGQTLMQGFLGVSEFQSIEVDGGSGGNVDGDEGDLDSLPVLGGGAQQKLGGEKVDFGLEGFFSFGGRANAAAFVVGGGGAAVAVDVDLMLFDVYGGPFVSFFLGDKLRVYGSVGPLVQWAIYDQENDLYHADGTGFGYGWYTRAGVEFLLASRTLIGFAARWSDSSIDLDSGLGDLDIEGFELLFTVSRGL